MDKKENSQYKIVDTAWETIQTAYAKYIKLYEGLSIHEEKFEEFKEKFAKMYEDTMNRFMKEDTDALDAHKQAAILTISCLETQIIEHELNEQDKISIVPQMIAINIGLSYMKDCMNSILKAKKIKKRIDKYYFPLAIACETPYQEIMCRILYHEQYEKDMRFNILELADRYFLLEYITLLQLDIEPNSLREKNYKDDYN